MVENTKIQNLKNKILSIINKLNCITCCKTSDNTPKPTSNTCIFSTLYCPYCKKRDVPIDVIKTIDKNNESCSYKWCHWCKKKSK